MKKFTGLLVLVVLLLSLVAVSGCTGTPHKTIGAQSGTTGEITAKELAGAGNESRVKTYDHITDVFPALQSGQVDAVINDYPVSKYYADSEQYKGQFKFVGELFPTKEPYAIVINKNNPELTKGINWAITQIKADGTYDQLLAKYNLSTGVTYANASAVANATTFNFTTSTPGTLKVATEAAWGPFEWINSSDANAQTRFVGFDMDLMREIAKRLNTTVEFTDQPFSGIITAVQGGQFDAGISSFSITPERQTQIDFSDPYYEIQQAIMVRATDDSINNATQLKNS